MINEKESIFAVNSSEDYNKFINAVKETLAKAKTLDHYLIDHQKWSDFENREGASCYYSPEEFFNSEYKNLEGKIVGSFDYSDNDFIYHMNFSIYAGRGYFKEFSMAKN